MKNIKVMKKEYIVIEKKELDNILSDINLFATMISRDAQEAKLHNCDFSAGLSLAKIEAICKSTSEYIAEFRSELI